jgi:hypothetical protein
MEYFAVAEFIDPQDAEESSISIVKPTKVIYSTGTQVSALTYHKSRRPQPKFRNPLWWLWSLYKSQGNHHTVEISLPKQNADIFIPGMNTRDNFAAAESMSSPFEKQLCDHTQVTQDIVMNRRFSLFVENVVSTLDFCKQR